jgi:two-component sensor histidine kinase
VHEELYRSTDLADIDMASYVRKLASNLFFAYQSAGARVTLDIDVHDVYLPVDAAVPCGLIINELMSNSLKYAFGKRPTGVITVRFQREGDSFRLMVGDDGVGLPSELDIEHSESLGLQLVSILAKQLHATLEVSRAQGTSFVLSFVSHAKHAHA